MQSKNEKYLLEICDNRLKIIDEERERVKLLESASADYRRAAVEAREERDTAQKIVAKENQRCIELLEQLGEREKTISELQFSGREVESQLTTELNTARERSVDNALEIGVQKTIADDNARAARDARERAERVEVLNEERYNKMREQRKCIGELEQQLEQQRKTIRVNLVARDRVEELEAQLEVARELGQTKDEREYWGALEKFRSVTKEIRALVARLESL